MSEEEEYVSCPDYVVNHIQDMTYDKNSPLSTHQGTCFGALLK